MKNHFAALLLFLAFSFQGVGQEVVMHENVDEDTINYDFGPNRSNFAHFLVQVGFPVGPSDSAGAELIPFSSVEWTIGSRSKFKVSEFYSVGVDATLMARVFDLKQDSGKVFPNPVLHDDERWSTWGVDLGFFNRFNIGKRGNVLGRYIDLGAFAGWNFSNRHKAFNNSLDSNNTNNAGREKVVYTKLKYINNLNYGVTARIGVENVALYARYRFSDYFQKEFNYPEFTRLTVGLDFAFY